ncbi:MAG: segregation/condensation protein A [Candidatus Methylacidiphilales bacterium]|nr:segregation/condensation protein A [Candidatus Methylacidiphilales bacterium]
MSEITDLPTDPWRVSLPSFEGPLDLLLYLIKKTEVDIYDIEIASITDQYLSYLDHMVKQDLEVAGEFLVVAANLIYIKSRTLLPEDQQPPEEDAEEEDPRWELIKQLVEYKKFKDAAGNLGERERLRELIFHREAKPVLAVSQEPAAKPGLGRVGVIDLVKAFQTVLQRARERDGFKEIYEDKYTVSDKIQSILALIEKQARLRFFELFHDMTSRTEIAVTFLALLELIRLKQLKCVQSDVFGDIDILRA